MDVLMNNDLSPAAATAAEAAARHFPPRITTGNKSTVLLYNRLGFYRFGSRHEQTSYHLCNQAKLMWKLWGT